MRVFRGRDRWGGKCTARRRCLRRRSAADRADRGSVRRWCRPSCRRRGSGPGLVDETNSLPRAASHPSQDQHAIENHYGNDDPEHQKSFSAVRTLHPHQLDDPAMTVVDLVVLVVVSPVINHRPCSLISTKNRTIPTTQTSATMARVNQRSVTGPLPARRDAPSFLEALLVAVERLTMQPPAR